MTDDHDFNPYATPEYIDERPLKILSPLDVSRVIWFYKQTGIVLIAMLLWVVLFFLLTVFMPGNYGRITHQDTIVRFGIFAWFYGVYVVLRTFGSMRCNIIIVLIMAGLSCYPLSTWLILIYARISAFRFLERYCEHIGFWKVKMRQGTESVVDF